MNYRKLHIRKTFYFFFTLFIGLYSCRKIYVDHQFRQTYEDVNEAIDRSVNDDPYFKIHLKNGDVSLMENWELNGLNDSIHGEGTVYDFNRNTIHEGKHTIKLEDIAIIETNQLNEIKGMDKDRISTLSIMTGIDAMLGILCITNPKACFGSCPTFYIEGEHFIHQARAEGFSSSIAPILERRDVDALKYSTRNGRFKLTMKNEAWESHMVNELHLLAVPKDRFENIFQDKKGRFYSCGSLLEFKHATSSTKYGPIKHLRKLDEQEYFSETDEYDLAKKESILLEWLPPKSGNYGIALDFRQTLLTTFLLYSGISYMGDEFGDYFAKIETDEKYKNHISNPFRKLGNIDLFLWNEIDNSWETLDAIFETGPIAKNLVLVPLNRNIEAGKPLKLKIEMSKGMWRIDCVALTPIKKLVEPLKVDPSSITAIYGENYSVEQVKFDDDKYVVSFPGDVYDFQFDLPDISANQEYELFLSTKGYYLEWIRQAWIKDKQPEKLKKMLLNDKKTWRDLAQEYKSIEMDMESVFWNSKFSNIQ